MPLDRSLRRSVKRTSSHKLIAKIATTAVIAIATFGASALPAQSAVAAAASCSYGDQAGGLYKDSICWIDMSTYDETQARTPDGQPMTVDLGGGYTASFALKDTSIGAPMRSIVPSPLPVLGTPGSGSPLGGATYAGTTGSPALYLAAGARNSGNRLTLDGITVTGPTGAPVTGFAFVGGEAETLTTTEGLYWASDVPITVLDRGPVTQDGVGCPVPLPGDGTPTPVCLAQAAGTDVASATIVRADNPTQFTQALVEGFGGSRQAVAFGIMTAKVELQKQVDGRIAPTDSFGTSITDAQGEMITGANTGAESTSTTGSVVVIPNNNQDAFMLAESATAGSLENYTAAWTCVNSVESSTTVLPDGTGTEKQLLPQPGDDITCRIVNTPDAYTVSKTVSQTTGVADDTLSYTVTVTNTGPGDYTDDNPATFTDDLTDVLDDAMYNNDASAGTTVSGNTLTWSGPLAIGESVTITYSVTANAAGNLRVTNAVIADGPGGTCDPDSTCTVETTLTKPVIPTAGPVDPTTPAPTSSGQQQSSAHLASTGAGSALPLLIGGGVLLLVGVAVLTLRRRSSS